MDASLKFPAAANSRASWIVSAAAEVIKVKKITVKNTYTTAVPDIFCSFVCSIFPVNQDYQLI